MKPRNVLAGLALSAALTAGMAGTAAAQGTPGTDAPSTGARKEFICSHQDQIRQLMGQHKTLLSSRLALLKDARKSAVDAGADALVVRIDHRIAKVVKAQERVETRMQKLTTWVGKSCAG